MKLFYKYNLIIILLSVIVFPQQKQSGSLKDMHIVGKVLDSSTKHTIEYANVVVFSLKDSSPGAHSCPDIIAVWSNEIQITP